MLFGKTAVDKVGKTVNRIRLVCSVSYKSDGSTLGYAERENAEKALCINAAIVLFYPNRALIRVSLSDEKRSRACVQTDAVLHSNVASDHSNVPQGILLVYNSISK